MANAAYDFAPKKFFIIRIGKDGPERIQGNSTYETKERATEEAHKFLKGTQRKDVIAVVEVAGLHRLKVSTELVDVAPPQTERRD